MKTLLLLVVAAPLALAAAPAFAGPYDDVYFVKVGGDAHQMFADRNACTLVAKSIGIGHGEAYSDPDYGLLSAMGTALDSDSLHGGIGRKVHRAALEKCMQKRGWTQQDPLGDDTRSVKKASESHPEALDAWIKANQPKPEEKKAAPPSPAAKTAAASAATSSTPAAPPAPSPSPTPLSPAATPAVTPPAQAAPPQAPTPQPHN
jgi:hypothetical protein